MGLKQGGLRGSVRNISTGVGIPDSVIDNFEPELYDDQNKTLSDYYTGDLSYATRQTSTVLEGTTSLRFDTTGTGPGVFRILSPGPNAGFGQGDTVRWKIQFLTNYGTAANGSFVYGASDVDNLYEAQVNLDSNGIYIRERDGGSGSTLTSTSVTINTSTTYIGELAWGTDDSHTLTLYDNSLSQLAQTSVTDATKTSGDMGWSVYESDTIFDIAELQ